MASSINAIAPVNLRQAVGAEAGRPELTRARQPADNRPTEVTVLDLRSGEGPAVSEAVEKVRDFVQLVQHDLEFTVDENTGRTVITVLDSESGDIVRQIPPAEILAIAENLEELGVLFRGQA